MILLGFVVFVVESVEELCRLLTRMINVAQTLKNKIKDLSIFIRQPCVYSKCLTGFFVVKLVKYHFQLVTVGCLIIYTCTYNHTNKSDLLFFIYFDMVISMEGFRKNALRHNSHSKQCVINSYQ